MEKRFVVFIILTMVIIVGYNAILMKFGPKPPEPKAKSVAEKKPEVPAKTDEPSQKAEKDLPVEKPAPASTAAKPGARKIHPHRVVTLGSYGGKSPTPLLVTLSSRGAGLERVELVGLDSKGKLRYRDLDNTGGYLGSLSLTTDVHGARVMVVPPGTPAAMANPSDSSVAAGLQTGDVIVSINEKKVATPRELENLLAETKPDDTVKLVVDRTTGGKTNTLTFTTKLAVRPFQLIKPEPLEIGELRPHPLSMLVTMRNAAVDREQFLDRLHHVEWEVRMNEGDVPGVAFHYVVDADQAADSGFAGSFEVIKRYTLGDARGAKEPGMAGSAVSPYHLNFELEFRNLADQPQKLAYQLDGTNGLPTEGWWYLAKIHPVLFKGAGARDIVLHTDLNGHQLVGCPAIFGRAKKEEKAPNTPLFGEGESPAVGYIGVDTQYFAAALIPKDKGTDQQSKFARAEAMVLGDVTKKPDGWERTANVSYQLTSDPIEIAPQQTWRQEFTLFTGPKDPDVLAPYGLSEWVYYGWFGGIAKLLSSILHFFHNQLVGNYAIAIIMLTVLVRGCMFPISRKAAKNAAMMQELAPEMKKIAEKYKGNMEARGKAQQELFRKHNYNPLSGCWMMFLQLPVFMGLYRALAVDIELRQAPLIPGVEWASNLAGPDKLFYWKTGFLSFLTDESGWLGPYFNLLPIFTIGLFLVQQKLFTPPATDEQTAMQLKMMKYMTVIMGVLFYKVPAGLCVYFITSSLWGIAERKLLPKPKPPKLGEPSVLKPKPGDPSVEKPKSFLDRFMPKPEEKGNSPRRRPAKRPTRK